MDEQISMRNTTAEPYVSDVAKELLPPGAQTEHGQIMALIVAVLAVTTSLELVCSSKENATVRAAAEHLAQFLPPPSFGWIKAKRREHCGANSLLGAWNLHLSCFVGARIAKDILLVICIVVHSGLQGWRSAHQFGMLDA